MESLQSLIAENFRRNSQLWRVGRYSYPLDLPEVKTKILEIPIIEDNLEIPAAFIPDSLEPYSSIAVRLRIGCGKADYSSFDAAFRSIFIRKRKDGECIMQRMTAKKKDIVYNYYVGHGIIADSEEILAMLTWKLRKEIISNIVHYFLDTPIVRINPKCFEDTVSPMCRFLSSKFISMAVGCKVVSAISEETTCPRIIIEPCPFKFLEITAPNINTTNKDLLSPLLNHIDELVK